MTEFATTKLSDFDYLLDPALIATKPLAEREQSRLLVYDRKRQTIDHRHFSDLPEYLNPSDLLVLNDSRVFPARLRGRKETGGKVELLLLRPLGVNSKFSKKSGDCWEVLSKGLNLLPAKLFFPDGVCGTLRRNQSGEGKVLELDLSKTSFRDFFSFLQTWGEVPLPPYILKQRHKEDRMEPADAIRYQTVYASEWGSAAAPTAGLHFSPELIQKIRRKRVQTETLTLHIGLDTFQPIRSDDILNHQMHREYYKIPKATAVLANKTRKNNGKVVAVGTSVTRAIESAYFTDGLIQETEGETDLYITLGYQFKVVDSLITNFHLPKSTLLVLVAAFAGKRVIDRIYQEAIEHRYRFYSYGDSMLIL
ncbi:MAG: tRNA preQ1(34) S-adenosylmethionine ribosyltransferase-isomerase QueA [Nitrospiria bacterium]